MAQTTSISPGVTAENGAADINVPANQVWHIGIFTDHADGFQAIGPNQSILVVIDTPGADTTFFTLTRKDPVVSIRGKATVRTRRPAQPAENSANVGAFVNDEV